MLRRYFLEISVHDRIEQQHLFAHLQRLVLVLFERFAQAVAVIENLFRHAVDIGAKLRENLQFAVLRQREAELFNHLAHGLFLRGATDAGDREADVDRGAHTGMEQLRLQIDLTIGDRNHVGRNIGGDIARHRFHDRQGG